MGNYVITLTDKVKSDYTAYLDVLDADDGLNFTKHVDNTGGTAEDGVFNTIYTKADGDWVINVTFVENKSTMYISVNTAGVESLSPYLQSDYTDTSGTDTITLSMLKNTSQAIVDDVVVYEYGNTFVIQLPNGHFIINDSGDSGGYERKDFVNLITYLKHLPEQALTKRPERQHRIRFTLTHGRYRTSIQTICMQSEDSVIWTNFLRLRM